jgi:hypothetical protein
MEPRYRPARPGGVIPVTVPGDTVLVRSPHLVVWVGAVTAFPDSFEFTLMTLFDTRRTDPPEDFALHPEERSQKTWLAVQFSDGRSRAADLNTNTPVDQPDGPQLRMVDGFASWTEGWSTSRWWVIPLPPAGPVVLTIHLNGDTQPSGVGRLDGGALANAAARAETLWAESTP